MKLFDKIKRRTRDIIRAAKGEPWDDLERPVGFKRVETKVETHRFLHRTGPIDGGTYTRENLLAYEVKQAAKELGLCLLEAGFITLERTENRDPLSLQLARERDACPGYLITLEVKVVKPERKEGVRE